MKHKLYKIPTGTLSAIVVLIIVYLSLAADPVGEEMLLFPHSDKVAHFLAYLVCGSVFLMDYAKYKLPRHTKIGVELALTVVASLLGLILEIVQLSTDSRSYDLLDWVADTAGAFVGFLLMHFWLLHYYRKYFYGAAIHQRHVRRRKN